MKYHIVLGSTIRNLENIVNSFLKNGRKLQGGPFVSISGDYYQALFKEEK